MLLDELGQEGMCLCLWLIVRGAYEWFGGVVLIRGGGGRGCVDGEFDLGFVGVVTGLI